MGKQRCAESQFEASTRCLIRRGTLVIDCHPVRGRGRSWSWEVVVQLSKAPGMRAGAGGAGG